MTPPNPPPHRRRNTLGLAALVVAILVFLPYGHLLLLPAIYLNTHLHELSHALAAIATGGTPGQILVRADGSGVCFTRGGSNLVIASAGYLGASLLGGVGVLVARTESGARLALRALSVALAISMLLLVRGDAVGLAMGAVWTIGLWTLARRLGGETLIGVTQFLGLVQGLQSLTSIADLLRISATAATDSDATNLAAATGVPALAWALLWAALSLAFTGWALVRATRSRPASGPDGSPSSAR